MSNYSHLPTHYTTSQHIVRDDRGNPTNLVINNSFRVNPPSPATNGESENRQYTPPGVGTPASTPRQSLSPAIVTNLPGRAIHFENCYNVQTIHNSNFVGRPPSTKQSKQCSAAPKIQEASPISNFDKEFSSRFEDAFSIFDEAFSGFDEAFSTCSRRRRRSQPAKPHTPSISTGPPIPQPTHYLSAPQNTIPTPTPYYDPFIGLSAKINSSVQTMVNGVHQVVNERIQEQEAALQEAGRTIRLATHRETKPKAPSPSATARPEDVPTTPKSACPGFSEDKTRDDAGNTITVAKLCSHADCTSFMSADDSTSGSQGFRVSSSSKSWSTPDCKLSCPGSLRYEETDSLGNVKITSKLCIHEADSKEAKANESEAETVVESDSDLDDDAAYERAKRASMQPYVQDASDDEDWNVI
ncbi:hypothetical protein M413DRAFT_447746 [Hebeloma cylindrosporum]|uniref:Uncharacterized protein n=1 Tax=Hebeloma cylindrosporum TaxID=76867 RepID=A0A0C3C4I9_HEBCY|nr:hypothetical protein M413DRAFT_447746 [Hebeloma cylindrosporum h7]